MKDAYLTKDERIKYYLSQDFLKDIKISGMQQEKGLSYEKLTYFHYFLWCYTRKNVSFFEKVKMVVGIIKHDKKFIQLLKRCNKKRALFFKQIGDVNRNNNEYILSKARSVQDKKSTILKCFNFSRHWMLVYKKPKDVLFENKENKIIWRGATTGNPKIQASRFFLVENYFNKNSAIDIGFSKIVQNRKDYLMYKKPHLSPAYMLKYKYIISIEGNDKDSGLNWKLNSNSLVMMSKPKVVSGLMEDVLIPDYHYILLKDDFSNLEERFKWCKDNQDKVKKIIKNANMFMKQFMDLKAEQEIEEKVLTTYFEEISKSI